MIKYTLLFFIITILNFGLLSQNVDITFIVKNNLNLIDGAVVSVDNYPWQTTDNNGVTVFTNVAVGQNISYSVVCSGYENYYSVINNLYTDTTINIVLLPVTYNLTFNVQSNNAPVDGAIVELESSGSILTNSFGIAFFDKLNTYISYGYLVSKDGFNQVSGTVNSRVDTTIYINLDKAGNSVTFKLTSKTGNVTNAKVELGNYEPVYTNTYGIAVINNVANQNSVSYKITHNNYETATGSITINGQNVYYPVSLVPISYSVTFNVTLNNIGLIGAKVSVDGYGNDYTDQFGVVRFSKVEAGVNHTYKIEHVKIGLRSGFFKLTNSDTVINLELISSVINNKFDSNIYPNPGTGLFYVSNANGCIINVYNLNGSLVFSDTIYNNLTQLNLSAFNKGVYIIKIESGKSSRFVKIIIQ